MTVLVFTIEERARLAHFCMKVGHLWVEFKKRKAPMAKTLQICQILIKVPGKSNWSRLFRFCLPISNQYHNHLNYKSLTSPLQLRWNVAFLIKQSSQNRKRIQWTLCTNTNLRTYRFVFISSELLVFHLLLLSKVPSAEEHNLFEGRIVRCIRYWSQWLKMIVYQLTRRL